MSRDSRLSFGENLLLETLHEVKEGLGEVRTGLSGLSERVARMEATQAQHHQPPKHRKWVSIGGLLSLAGLAAKLLTGHSPTK